MCEKKVSKITKGSQVARQRETRRLQRLQNLRMTPSPAARDTSNPAHSAHLPQINLPINKAAQNKVILELAWKTVLLMHKNKLIQQKIIDLQKETSEFVANIMNNPENRLRYLERMRSQAATAVRAQDTSVDNKENIIKMEPDA